ncbi:hypothetical protein VFC49_09780 [Thermococcus sp. SY098]|uniref:hypothetical protein n=1 Tax=Thermococcus sp. SY098 TaxID=3111325 RepID=UPI002D76C9D8|nr:hypothetical protein [Thermococcus sp. SY098]WRS52325.1 hypothetical protein VFC49_09780 [Thermococcus sp. SY098]
MNKYLMVAGLFMSSLPSALCQEDDRYLTGFHVSGPLIGVAIILGLILLLWLILKLMLKLIVVGITSLTFGGVGYLIGTMFLPNLAIYIGGAFFILGLWLSLKLLRAQGGKIAVVKTSSEHEDSFFNDDWGEEDEEF